MRGLFYMLGSGRTKIYSNYTEITKDNISDVLLNAYPIFAKNVSEINALYSYYKGQQTILQREKKIRPEHNAKIVSNVAYSIVQFKTGYLLDKPIQYVARKDEVVDENLIALNDFMVLEGKESKDKAIANAKEICGVAYRLALPNKNYQKGALDESPFNLYTLKPQQTFVVYSTDIGEKPLLACVVLTTKDLDGNEIITLQAYSKDTYYEFVYGTQTLLRVEPHIIKS